MHPRVSLDIPVAVLTGGFSQMEARTVDLSIGGLKLRSPSTLQPGTVVALRFTLPDERTLSSLATVMHETAGAIMGLAFTCPSREFRNVLAEFTARMNRYARRGERVARHYRLLVCGAPPDHNQEEHAMTVTIGPHGGLFLSRVSYALGEKIHISWPEKGRNAGARIVSRTDWALLGLAELGFEFEDGQEFWDRELVRPSS